MAASTYVIRATPQELAELYAFADADRTVPSLPRIVQAWGRRID